MARMGNSPLKLVGGISDQVNPLDVNAVSLVIRKAYPTLWRFRLRQAHVRHPLLLFAKRTLAFLLTKRFVCRRRRRLRHGGLQSEAPECRRKDKYGACQSWWLLHNSGLWDSLAMLVFWLELGQGNSLAL